ncbi:MULTISPECIES: helix-turn-helix domain-containing protein [Lysinibacillus]|uniref:Helix-turn-helix domain-containing protein n=1 Tax=Lysinibacillus capsici TaxID=2115968 RepID=A0ABY8KKD8_9BACI|nr:MULTISPECIES: helix-turn-helix domain-containing protein [Lysinibacillus]WHP39520.1 helix-turn-helix domain-containing protein [Lysinibacillus boronitolerans]MCT1540905.1 helix-turn-helix domain-containing protein [Lysinibacillus capsici]MCT1572025.1 helix-turn-helix domain-containing protein [Lysinibacillus capsici]MCT1649190.1 helix-turn-helix domain-containing protein [Lysinibacillus capsici]MCT1727669.1 helix-turn-helix domain-containing protein [Lysinibacillus capsici]
MLLVAELGTRLKEARLSKGYSLDDLQEITKIQKRYLVGIEEGNYSIMPGSFYVRAFIKQYAEAVGLDAEEILETYKNELPSTPNDQVSQSMTNSPSRRKVTKGPSNKMMEAMPKIIVALFIVVIIVAIWVLWQSKNSPGTSEEVNPTPEIEYDTNVKPIDSEKDKKEQENKDAQKNDKEDTKATEETPTDEDDTDQTEEMKQTISAGTVEADGATTSYTLTGTDTMKLKIEISGPTFVGIRNQQQQEILTDTRVYNAGEVVEFDASTQNYVRIRLGNSTQAKIYINDELLTYAQQIVTQNIVINFNKEQ